MKLLLIENMKFFKLREGKGDKEKGNNKSVL